MLQLKNLARWLKEYIVSWGLLSAIYSLTLTLILQPLLEKALKQEIRLGPLWFVTCLLLLIPGVLEWIPAPAIAWRVPGFIKDPLARLYLRHELRRGMTWLTLLLVVAFAYALPAGKKALWILIAQLMTQRALYSVHRWRTLAVSSLPETGAKSLLKSMIASQTLQLVVAWILVWRAMPAGEWLRLGPAAWGAILCASAVSLEGDSGRPWMVNFISMAAGTLGGFLCLASPWCLAGVVYFVSRMLLGVKDRLQSVEFLDEDRLIS